MPARIVLYAAEKWGKTSFAAHAPKPFVLMTNQEDGFLTLKSMGLVPPEAASLPEYTNRWCDLVDTVGALINEKHDFKTLVVDTGNGAERMLADAVCDEEFRGNWADFADYGKGEQLCKPHWTGFLGRLDALRVKRGMSIIITHHTQVKTVNNPTGKDWDQHRPEGMKNLWGLTHKWADAILYGGWKVDVGRIKGEKHGDDKALAEERYIRAGNASAIVAGSRFNLPDEIRPKRPGAAGMWDAFAAAMKAASPPSPPAASPPAPAGNGRTSTLPRTGANGKPPSAPPPPPAEPDDEIPFGHDGPDVGDNPDQERMFNGSYA
jgi:hypothetical protein